MFTSIPKVVTLCAVSASFAIGASGFGCAPTLDDSFVPNDDSADASDKLAKELETKYGLAPKNYPFLFDGSNAAEREFSAAITDAATKLNQIAVNRGANFTVHEGALGLNFISEGGYFPLKDDRTSGIDGFGEVGIDTLVSNFNGLEPWLDSTLAAEISACDLSKVDDCNCNPYAHCDEDYGACIAPSDHDPAVCEATWYACTDEPVPPGTCPEVDELACAPCSRIVGHVNERGEYFYTMTDLTMNEAVGANASMYAYSKFFVERDFTAAGLVLSEQPPEEQFFWTTMYFNAGIGTAGRRLTDNGHKYYEDKWPAGAEDNWLNPLYNALWRTSSYEYIMIKLYGGLDAAN